MSCRKNLMEVPLVKEGVLTAQVILYSGESLITQRPSIEMACIRCNGGV